MYQRRTVELRLQSLNGWENEHFDDTWNDVPEERLPTKVFPLPLGGTVREVYQKVIITI